MKHNKSNIAFLHEIIPDAVTIPWVYILPQGKTIFVAFIYNADCPNRFFFDGHPSTSKFLIRFICSLQILSKRGNQAV